MKTIQRPCQICGTVMTLPFVGYGRQRYCRSCFLAKKAKRERERKAERLGRAVSQPRVKRSKPVAPKRRATISDVPCSRCGKPCPTEALTQRPPFCSKPCAIASNPAALALCPSVVTKGDTYDIHHRPHRGRVRETYDLER
jgi:endogenous inhibitor of DNA gyrase (YacG/DUF329 family)